MPLVLPTAVPPPPDARARPALGVLQGSGIGAEVVNAALKVLSALEEAAGITFDLRLGGAIGEEAEKISGQPLTSDVVEFCEDVFSAGGAVLCGPGGGRFVYDLRRRFDLFCKLAPVHDWPVLADAARVRHRDLAGLDFLIVRDNCAGVYQGTWSREGEAEHRAAHHAFCYRAEDIRRLAWVAAKAAGHRRGRVHVVVKDAGIPAISALWREVTGEVAREARIECSAINVDYAAYEMMQNPERLDVVLTPNLFGDILVDLAGVLQGSRGVTFSGNFNPQGHGVYQTNHGCAHDLAHTDTANPAGQILALAMLLRESFGLEEEALRVETALVESWAEGWRTADIAGPGSRIVGTQAMADRVAERLLSSVPAETSLP